MTTFNSDALDKYPKSFNPYFNGCASRIDAVSELVEVSTDISICGSGHVLYASGVNGLWPLWTLHLANNQICHMTLPLRHNAQIPHQFQTFNIHIHFFF
jgi:hypothetical protein